MYMVMVQLRGKFRPRSPVRTLRLSGKLASMGCRREGCSYWSLQLHPIPPGRSGGWPDDTSFHEKAVGCACAGWWTWTNWTSPETLCSGRCNTSRQLFLFYLEIFVGKLPQSRAQVLITRRTSCTELLRSDHSLHQHHVIICQNEWISRVSKVRAQHGTYNAIWWSASRYPSEGTEAGGVGWNGAHLGKT